MEVREFATEADLPDPEGLPVGLLVLVGGSQFWKLRAISREWEPCAAPPRLAGLIAVDDEDVEWEEDPDEELWDDLSDDESDDVDWEDDDLCGMCGGSSYELCDDHAAAEEATWD